MKSYSKSYLIDVCETQGKLFDYVAYNYSNKDTIDFINYYMGSKTRLAIDKAQAYVNTMDVESLWQYFKNNENYTLKDGQSLKGFVVMWIGEFYAYYQWYYNILSSKVIKKIPVSFLLKAYNGLHDLDLELAVKKVGPIF